MSKQLADRSKQAIFNGKLYFSPGQENRELLMQKALLI